jgi:hypothetical protein
VAHSASQPGWRQVVVKQYCPGTNAPSVLARTRLTTVTRIACNVAGYRSNCCTSYSHTCTAASVLVRATAHSSDRKLQQPIAGITILLAFLTSIFITLSMLGSAGILNTNITNTGVGTKTPQDTANTDKNCEANAPVKQRPQQNTLQRCIMMWSYTVRVAYNGRT